MILICCLNLFKENAKKYNFNNRFSLINKNANKFNLSKNLLNIIDIKLKKVIIKIFNLNMIMNILAIVLKLALEFLNLK